MIRKTSCCHVSINNTPSRANEMQLRRVRKHPSTVSRLLCDASTGRLGRSGHRAILKISQMRLYNTMLTRVCQDRLHRRSIKMHELRGALLDSFPVWFRLRSTSQPCGRMRDPWTSCNHHALPRGRLRSGRSSRAVLARSGMPYAWLSCYYQSFLTRFI